jgi:hypothetical protein
VGYEKQTLCGIFCPAYHVYYKTEGSLFSNSILLKGADEAGALKVANAFYAAIAHTAV